MAALVVLFTGAVVTVAGAVAGWCPAGRGMFTAGILVLLAGADLATDDGDEA